MCVCVSIYWGVKCQTMRSIHRSVWAWGCEIEESNVTLSSKVEGIRLSACEGKVMRA